MGFGTVSIVGVGLIGGSLGLALRARGLAQRVVGVGWRQASLDKALERGAVDAATTDLPAGVAPADLVVFATPVDLTVELLRQARPACRAGAVATDVGSTKRLIVEQADALDGQGPAFVGGHPLAGLEQRGVEAARADLFERCTCVLTPTAKTPPAAIARVTGLWQAVGARVTLMDPAEHDRALAAVSHLPHLVAAALVGSVPAAYRALAATGFASTTRIAASDPRLWTPIFRHNRRALLEALKGFQAELDRFREAVQRDDPAAIQALLEKAKTIRDALAS